ncbi:MAG: molecular chaperone DnaJ, partial [Deltaproteobacteria bacterium]|nr:molecular chaperone DnaJ [Deltaproteobacteria bacterium]
HIGKNHGKRGDLFIQIEVMEHPLFERHNNDLKYICRISMALAALGGFVEVPLIEGGSNKLQVPPGTQTLQTITFEGLGAYSIETGNRGNMVVEFFVQTPSNLSKEENRLLSELLALEAKKDT